MNDAGQIAGYAFNSFTGQTPAVRLQPASTPPIECTFHCLRSTRIVLHSQALSGGINSIKGTVKVRDENAATISGALGGR